MTNRHKINIEGRISPRAIETQKLSLSATKVNTKYTLDFRFLILYFRYRRLSRQD